MLSQLLGSYLREPRQQGQQQQLQQQQQPQQQQQQQQPQQQQQQQQPQQQQQQMPTPDNTLGLAMLIAAGSGKSLGDTLPIAAEITYKQQMAQAEDAKRQQALYAQMQPEENVISNHVTGEYVKQRKQNGLVTGLSNIVPDAQGGQGMGGMANLIQQQRENPIPDSIAPMPETQNPNNPYITPRDKMDIRRETAEEEKEVRKEKRKMNDEFLTKAGDVSIASSKLLPQFQQAKLLIPKFSSGTFNALSYQQQRAFKTKRAAAYERFVAITSRLALDIAIEQKGSQSDNDMKIILATKPNVDNTEEGNRQIIENLELSAQRDIEFSDAANEWIKRGGNANEFKVAWAKYVNQNPLFAQDNNNNITVNRDSLTNWKEAIFGEKPQKGDAAEVSSKRDPSEGYLLKRIRKIDPNYKR
jgi:hypothetical protein